jgi:hypothetical protein
VTYPSKKSKRKRVAMVVFDVSSSENVACDDLASFLGRVLFFHYGE